MNNSYTNKNLTENNKLTINWKLIQTNMMDKLGADIYESWLKKIDLEEEFSNYVLLSVPTRFIRDWIASRYLDQILKIIKDQRKEIIRIEFKIIDKVKRESEIDKNIDFDYKRLLSSIQQNRSK